MLRETTYNSLWATRWIVEAENGKYFVGFALENSTEKGSNLNNDLKEMEEDSNCLNVMGCKQSLRKNL